MGKAILKRKQEWLSCSGSSTTNRLALKHSLVDDSTYFTYTGNNNLLDVEPLLAPLALNGGPYADGQTHTLGEWSTAFNADLNISPAQHYFDQRGRGFAETARAMQIWAPTETKAPPSMTSCS